MAVSVEFKPIIPKELNIKAYSDAATKLLKQEAKIIKREFSKTTKTFNNPVKFAERNTSTRSQLSRLVFASDKQYFFVTRGTRIRWALMSQDFNAKTSARVIGSRRGRGRAVIIGKRAMQARNIAPRPGIKAREFDLEIVKRRQPKFVRNANKAFNLATRKANKR